MADWQPEAVAAVEQWAHTRQDARTRAPWRSLGRAVPGADGWLILDRRDDRRLSPESLHNACFCASGGPERAPAFPVEELRVVDGVIHLREPAGLPPSSRHVWTQAMSPRFLVERLAQGLRAATSVPLADALAQRELAGPPTARIEAPGLLDPQVEALRACLSPGVRLVWGPPGTGKTEVLARAIEQQVRRGQRVLLVSTANVAVDNALLAAVRRLQPTPGTVLRVGPAQLPEIATDPGVQLERLAARASADADRERERVGTALAELVQADEDIDRLRAELVDYDDSAFRQAAVRADGEIAARTLRTRVGDARAEVERADAELHEAQLERDQAERAAADLAIQRGAYADLDRLSAELEQLDAERAAAELARDTASIAAPPTGWWAARRHRARQQQTIRDAEVVLAAAAPRRADLLALQEKAHQVIGAVPRSEVAELDQRSATTRTRATQAEADHDRAQEQLAAAQRDLALVESLGTPSTADRELVASCRAAGQPTRFAELLRQQAVRRGTSADRRAALEAEHRQLVDRCRRLRSDAERELVREADVVATTLARARVHPTVSTETFDVVLVDEAGAATLAEVLLALCRGRTTAVLFGDFLQLGPVLETSIERHDDPGVRQWIAGTCFSHLGIGTPAQAVEHRSCTALLDQFRFGPQLRALANDVTYEVLRDADRGDRRQTEIVLVDMSTVPELAEVRAGPGAGKWWTAGVVLARALAELHLADGEVGIVTPYRRQAEATLAGVRDRALVAGVSVGTAHAFQGREFGTVVFDLVEDGRGWVANARRGAGSYEDKGLRLFGVGITRARERLYLLVDGDAVAAAAHGPLAALRRALGSGQVRRWSAAALLGLDEPPAGPADTLFDDVAGVLRQLVTVTDVHDEHQFVAELERHVVAARRELWMWSPWLANRAKQVVPLLGDAVRRGVDVRVVVRPDHDAIMRQRYAQQRLVDLHAAGATVIRSDLEHRKIVVVDRSTVLLGSLNPLSAQPGATREVMLTMQGKAFAERLLEEIEAETITRPRPCTGCGAAMEVRRRTGRKPELYWHCRPCRVKQT